MEQPMHDPDIMALELEQLRTALEESLSENARLVASLTQQRLMVDQQARDLRALTARLRAHERTSRSELTAEQEAQQNGAEEELRVAFEELQVMTEELEVANSSLQQVNRELDSRVEIRTRELASANTALRESES